MLLQQRDWNTYRKEKSDGKHGEWWRCRRPGGTGQNLLFLFRRLGTNMSHLRLFAFLDDRLASHWMWEKKRKDFIYWLNGFKKERLRIFSFYVVLVSQSALVSCFRFVYFLFPPPLRWSFLTFGSHRNSGLPNAGNWTVRQLTEVQLTISWGNIWRWVL